MTSKEKRVYTTPLLSSFVVDREITLVMISDPPVDPGGGFGAPAYGGDDKTINKEASPFGGSSPDYSKM